MNIDPLAENHHRNNPYMYANNNPVIFIDPDGRDFTLTGQAAQSFVSGLQTAMDFADINKVGLQIDADRLGGENEYKPLTNEILKNYLKEKYGVPDNQLGDFVGKYFENAFIKFGEINFESEANFRGITERSTLSIPDAYSDGEHINILRLMSVRYDKSVWWEVKARNKNVSLDKQIKGFIDGLNNEFKYTAIKTRNAFLAIVTTSNSGINPDVYIYAESKRVNIQHWQAQYKMVNDSMHVDFGYKNSPVSPTIYQFSKPVKL